MKKNHSKKGVISKKRLNILKNKEKSYGSVQNITHYLFSEGVRNMLEVLKSKVMILFVVLVMGVIFIDCSFNNNLENNDSNENLVALNS